MEGGQGSVWVRLTAKESAGAGVHGGNPLALVDPSGQGTKQINHVPYVLLGHIK